MLEESAGFNTQNGNNVFPFCTNLQIDDRSSDSSSAPILLSAMICKVLPASIWIDQVDVAIAIQFIYCVWSIQWEANHRMQNRPIAIDLFSGVGGMSLGFEQAGFNIAAAIEIDPIHAAAHHYNFPNCTTIPQSIAKLSGTDIRRLGNLGNRTIDLVIGGAPCQGFSLIGKRAIDDPRNSLVRDFVRIVSELDANAFVFENVKGLTLGKHKLFLEQIVQEFRRVGYKIQNDRTVLNAAHFGVPQNRERLFLIGVKKEFDIPSYPIPISRKPTESEPNELPIVTTAKAAIGDIPNAEKFQVLKKRDWVRVSKWGNCSEYARKLRCSTQSDWHFGYVRSWESGKLTGSMRTDHSAVTRRRFHETKTGAVEPISRFFKLDRDGISNTLRAGTDATRGAFTSPRPIHYKYDRCITVREMARIHGFPDWFRFHQTKWHGARQIGNAVPPPLARAVANQVIQSLGYRPSKPAELVLLGDERLLTIDMSQASKYWGVDTPISKRSFKSGAKKRKQSCIEADRLKCLAAE